LTRGRRTQLPVRVAGPALPVDFPLELTSPLFCALGTVASWRAHQNAIFDFTWSENDSKVVTASGDQSLVVWDVATGLAVSSFARTKPGACTGHAGSIKAVDACPSAFGNDFVIMPHLACSFQIQPDPSRSLLSMLRVLRVWWSGRCHLLVGRSTACPAGQQDC